MTRRYTTLLYNVFSIAQRLYDVLLISQRLLIAIRCDFDCVRYQISMRKSFHYHTINNYSKTFVS